MIKDTKWRHDYFWVFSDWQIAGLKMRHGLLVQVLRMIVIFEPKVVEVFVWHCTKRKATNINKLILKSRRAKTHNLDQELLLHEFEKKSKPGLAMKSHIQTTFHCHAALTVKKIWKGSPNHV